MNGGQYGLQRVNYPLMRYGKNDGGQELMTLEQEKICEKRVETEIYLAATHLDKKYPNAFGSSYHRSWDGFFASENALAHVKNLTLGERAELLLEARKSFRSNALGWLCLFLFSLTPLSLVRFGIEFLPVLGWLSFMLGGFPAFQFCSAFRKLLKCSPSSKLTKAVNYDTNYDRTLSAYVEKELNLADVEEKALAGRADSFSPATIQKAVLVETVQEPVTIFPVSIGALGWASMIFFAPTPVSILIGIGGLGIGAGAWVVNYCFRHESYANKHVRRMYEDLARERETALKGLFVELHACASAPECKDFAVEGKEQFTNVNEKFEVLREILGKKLNEGELTYVRFLGQVEEVYFAVIDNLRDIVNLLKSIKAIGNEADESLKKLTVIKNSSDTEKKQIATLTERVALKQKQIRKLKEILTGNDEAMTQIDVLTAALVDTKMKKGQATLDIETSIGELKELAARVHQYSVQ